LPAFQCYSSNPLLPLADLGDQIERILEKK